MALIPTLAFTPHLSFIFSIPFSIFFLLHSEKFRYLFSFTFVSIVLISLIGLELFYFKSVFSLIEVPFVCVLNLSVPDGPLCLPRQAAS